MLILNYFFSVLAANHGRLTGSQRGATLIEYVLIVAVIAIAVFAAGQFGLADAITSLFGKATDTLNNAGGAG